MASTRRKKKKSKKNLPVILISLAVGCLITLAVVYSPGWFQEEIDVSSLISNFQFSDSTAPPDTIYIEVWNGTGIADLAGRAQSFFETRSGQVTFYAPGPPINAEDMNYAETVIVSRDTSFSAAREVAEMIELGDSSIVMMLPSADVPARIDVTIILGRDRADPAYFIPYRN